MHSNEIPENLKVEHTWTHAGGYQPVGEPNPEPVEWGLTQKTINEIGLRIERLERAMFPAGSGTDRWPENTAWTEAGDGTKYPEPVENLPTQEQADAAAQPDAVGESNG